MTDQESNTGTSTDPLTMILNRIASSARQAGGDHAALRRATANLHRECGYTWKDLGNLIEVTTTDGVSGYLCSRQTRTPDRSWIVFIGGDASRVSALERRRTLDHRIFDSLPIEMQRVLAKLPSTEDVSAPVERLPWHILPPGEHPFPAVLEHFRVLAERHPSVEYDHTRLEKLNSLGPTAVYVGVDEFEGYVVFNFEHYAAAVLDCPIVGNAVYVMRDRDWVVLCQLSKAELLTQHRSRVRRIVHSGGWFERVRRHLVRYRTQMSGKPR